MPAALPNSVSTNVSPKSIFAISRREHPSALRMPISRVRSRTMVYILRSTTRKLMTMPMPTIVRIKGFNSGRLEEFMSDMYSDMERTRFSGVNWRISLRVVSVSPLLRT